MHNEAMTVSGTKVSLSPNCDRCIIDPSAKKLSVEYAKARLAINEDFEYLKKKGFESLAIKKRKEAKHTTVEFLKGTVSFKDEPRLDKNKQPIVRDGKPVMMKKYIVTFPDGSVARL